MQSCVVCAAQAVIKHKAQLLSNGPQHAGSARGTICVPFCTYQAAKAPGLGA